MAPCTQLASGLDPSTAAAKLGSLASVHSRFLVGIISGKGPTLLDQDGAEVPKLTGVLHAFK